MYLQIERLDNKRRHDQLQLNQIGSRDLSTLRAHMENQESQWERNKTNIRKQLSPPQHYSKTNNNPLPPRIHKHM